MSEHVVVFVSPFELEPHPANERIYRDAPSDEVIESIREVGIITPLICLPNKVVLSGHLRMLAARHLELETVPVVFRDDIEDGDATVEFLIHSNRTRQKTNEQLAREYQVLKAVEARRGRLRMGATDKGEGKSRDIAAATVGLSPRTAEKAVEVVAAIDEAEADGDEETAASLRDKLNNRSVNKAFKQLRRDKDDLIDAVDSPVPDHLRPVFVIAREARGIVSSIGQMRVRCENMFNEPGGEHFPVTAILTDAKNWAAALTAGRPFAVCPVCKGNGCKQCEGLGWMHKQQWGALPEALRKPAVEREVMA